VQYVRLGSITPLLRCLLYRPLSTLPDIFTSAWDDSAAAFLRLNCKRLSQPLRLQGVDIDPQAARLVTNEPAYRMHEMDEESAFVMLFPIFA
jgi:hypothetical protein